MNKNGVKLPATVKLFGNEVIMVNTFKGGFYKFSNDKNDNVELYTYALDEQKLQIIHQILRVMEEKIGYFSSDDDDLKRLAGCLLALIKDNPTVIEFLSGDLVRLSKLTMAQTKINTLKREKANLERTLLAG